MKNIKKLTSLLLVAVMLFAMSTTAFAAEQYSITIYNEVGSHTYEAYQIFKGDLSDGVLSNIEWGTGVTDAAKDNLGNAAAKAETIKTSAAAEAFAKEVAAYLSDECATSTVSAKAGENGKYVYTIENLEPGYYLVKDKEKSELTDGSAYTEYILKVVKNTEVEAKDSSVIVTKKVDDKNDSNTNENEIKWQDSADHDLGDMIDFQISTTLPSDFTEYKTYELTLHDKQSAGLTFKAETVVVRIGDEIVDEDFYDVVTTGLEHDCTFEIIFENVRAIDLAENNSVIEVTYKSQLNEKAVIGSAGNPNEVYGEYSNDHYSDETGKTPTDKVIVFTYKVNVDKVTKGENNALVPLKGAGFTLYKEVVADSTGSYPEGARTGAEIKDAFENPSIKADALKDNSYYIEVLTKVTDAEGDTFSFKHVDDGTYVLVETTIPAGYNAWDSQEFTVSATHDVEANAPELKKLEGGDLFTGEVSTGVLDTDIVNNAGTTLPETGGVGTTMFYVIGAILMVGAAVVMITRKRMSR